MQPAARDWGRASWVCVLSVSSPVEDAAALRACRLQVLPGLPHASELVRAQRLDSVRHCSRLLLGLHDRWFSPQTAALFIGALQLVPEPFPHLEDELMVTLDLEGSGQSTHVTGCSDHVAGRCLIAVHSSLPPSPSAWLVGRRKWSPIRVFGLSLPTCDFTPLGPWSQCGSSLYSSLA